MVKNLPATAGDTGFDPWSGRIPHAPEQLSPCVTTTEACAPRTRAPQPEKQQQWEARPPQLEEPLLASCPVPALSCPLDCCGRLFHMNTELKLLIWATSLLWKQTMSNLNLLPLIYIFILCHDFSMKNKVEPTNQFPPDKPLRLCVVVVVQDS